MLSESVEKYRGHHHCTADANARELCIGSRKQICVYRARKSHQGRDKGRTIPRFEKTFEHGGAPNLFIGSKLGTPCESLTSRLSPNANIFAANIFAWLYPGNGDEQQVTRHALFLSSSGQASQHRDAPAYNPIKPVVLVLNRGSARLPMGVSINYQGGTTFTTRSATWTV